MEWVDFKRDCAKYRFPYTDLYEHIVDTIELCKLTYEDYRDGATKYALPESDCAERLGLHLYYFAELENLCLGSVIPINKQCDSYEWSHMARSTRIIQAGRKKEISLEQLKGYCLGWVQSIYPYLSTQRLFDDAMQCQRLALIVKHKY